MDKKQRATALLLSHLPKTELYEPLRSAISNMSVMLFNDPDSVFAGAALRAIADALPDEQPARGEKVTDQQEADAVVTLFKRYQDHGEFLIQVGGIGIAIGPNSLLAPPAGPAVEGLVADMRERAAKVCEDMPIQIYRDEGIGMAGRSCKAATFDDAADRIRALPTTEKTHAQ